MIRRELDRRMLRRILWVGFWLRVFVAFLTPVPAEDAANYLWMAQQFAAGHAGAALDEVFPPLWPLVATPFVLIGDAFRMGQLVAAIAGALSIWPAARIVQSVAPGYATAVAWLLALAPLPVRFAGECYSEPVFLLVGGLAVLAGMRERWLWLGVLAGAAAWIRPEGALIAVAFAVVRPGKAWVSLLSTAGLVVLLAWWRHSVGHAFSLTPKLDFNLARGDAAWSDDGIHVGRFFANLLPLPGLWVEAFTIPGLFALVGLVAGRRRRELRPLYVLLLLGVIAIALFLPRRRFLVSWFFAVAPFIALGLGRLPEPARFPLWFVAMATSLLLCFHLQDSNRYSERVVGDFLATQLRPGEVVTGDMTRVVWFAGMRPLPPRHFTAKELAERARQVHARFVVLAEGRDNTPGAIERLESDYDTAAMPEQVRQAAELRGIVVLARKE